MIYADKVVPQRNLDIVFCHTVPRSTYAFALDTKPLHLSISFLEVQKVARCVEWQYESQVQTAMLSRLKSSVSSNTQLRE